MKARTLFLRLPSFAARATTPAAEVPSETGFVVRARSKKELTAGQGPLVSAAGPHSAHRLWHAHSRFGRSRGRVTL
jgi:hypothetical protein